VHCYFIETFNFAFFIDFHQSYVSYHFFYINQNYFDVAITSFLDSFQDGSKVFLKIPFKNHININFLL